MPKLENIEREEETAKERKREKKKKTGRSVIGILRV